MKVAAGVAVLTVSGTALAARTGNLPDSAQRRAHAIFASLGVPAPAPTPTAAPPTRTTGSSSAGTTAPATSGPGSATSTTPPGIGISPNAAAADLCRRWKADQDDPSGITLNADDHKTLRELAGSERDIPGYCATVPTPAPTTEPGTTPTDPGNPGRGRTTKTPGNGNPHTK